MKILPAIDLYEKKAVRLFQGDYRQMTVYSDHPCEIAQEFRQAGADFIHMVDLEGAKSGQMPNYSVVKEVIEQTGLQVEIGGGIRTEDAIRRYIDAAVARVILGTAALTDWDFLCRMVQTYGDKIAVGVDCKDGFVAIRGWTEVSQTSCDAFFQQLTGIGVRTAICTDISKDGAMQGTNRALYAQLSQQYQIDLIASGGVSTLEDIAALRQMGIAGAIIGKAYYNGAIDLRAAIEVAK